MFIKKTFNTIFRKERLPYFFISLLLIPIFFPIRHVFFTSQAYLTGQYSDFTSFSLYLSDIIIIFAFIYVLWSNISNVRSIVKGQVLIVLLIIWLILGFLWHFNAYYAYNLYFLGRWLLLIVAYGTIHGISNFKFQISKRLLFIAFLGLCTLQSIIAIIQFAMQSSIGLSRVGESALQPNILGVAKIVSHGTTYIRAYGTFPHPNVLAAFLLVGVLGILYAFLYAQNQKSRIILSIALLTNIIGFTVTFSRAAYLALFIGCVLMFVYILYEKGLGITNKKLFSTFGILIICSLISLLMFGRFIFTRASFQDNASIERIELAKIGLNMSIGNPIFGIGVGESVLHMEQYAKKPLEPWQKQPIHNYFLLAASELGIPGALLLLWVLFLNLKTLVAKIKYYVLRGEQGHATYYLLLATILICFLFLMQFDHYFYTLNQAQLLLWLFLGLVSSETKTHHSINDVSR